MYDAAFRPNLAEIGKVARAMACKSYSMSVRKKTTKLSIGKYSLAIEFTLRSFPHRVSLRFPVVVVVAVDLRFHKTTRRLNSGTRPVLLGVTSFRTTS